MARLPRLYAPAIVQHVVQRPLAGRRLFHDADDYRHFTTLLADAVRAHGVALHAYALTPSQFRLLATPPDAGAVSGTMQTIGRRYVGHANRTRGTSGPLWDRRFRSTLIDADAWLIASMRFIERQPVAEGLTATADAWPWSSFAHHAGDAQASFVTDHACYWALDDTPFGRQSAWRRLVATPLDPADAARIDHAALHGWLLGDAAFAAKVQPLASRRATPTYRGRRRNDLSP